jgi:ABC-2 type transport system permease protein
MLFTKQWFKQIGAIIWARNLEFFRDKAALSWNVLFPLLLIAGIYFGFNNDTTYSFKAGVVGQASDLKQELITLPIIDLNYIKYVDIENEAKGLQSLSRFGLDILIDPVHKEYWFNQESKEGYFLDKLIQKSMAGNLIYTRHHLNNTPVRYADWVWIGILVINIMYGCLYGIGYVLVRYRKNGHLKRLQVTPITITQFLLAQVVSRVGIVFASTSLVVLGCYFLLKPVLASHIDYVSLALVFLFGVLSFISLALLLCSRVTSEELSRGLIELVSWPMLICSGALFSLEGTHPWLLKFSSLLPSTHFIEASRQIALYGASFHDVWPNIEFLIGSMIIFFFIGIMLFKWQSNPTQS